MNRRFPRSLMHAGSHLPYLLGLSVLLGGCAADPVRQAAAAAAVDAVAPAQWHAPLAVGARAAADGPHAQSVTSRWWEGFGVAGLNAAIEQALRANPDLDSVRAALRQARAQRDLAQAQSGWSVTTSAAAQRTRSGDAAASNAWRAGLDAAWEADLWGQQAAAIGASEADLAASAATLEQARLALAAEVAATYWEWWGYRERLRLAQQTLQALMEGLQLADWRAQAGLASTLDVLSARTLVEQTRASVQTLSASAEQSANALAVLLGLPPGAALPSPAEAAPQPPAAWRLPRPAEVLRQRPDVAAAEAKLRAAVLREQQAQAARLPTLTLGGTLSLAAPRVADLFDVAAITRSLVLRLAGTLADGGAAQARVAVQQAAVEQARANLQSVLLSALRDVENALVSLAAGQERLDRLQSASAAASEAEALARQRYRAGLIDYRSLLDAQRTLLSAQSDLVAAQVQWANDHVSLFKALGAPPPAAGDEPAALSGAVPSAVTF